MIKPFDIAGLPKIFFGNGRISSLPQYINLYGRSIILVTDKGSFLRQGRSEYIFDLLEKNQIRYDHYMIEREPSPEIIDKAVSGFRGKGHSAVVAIGGGSVMDAGKAISAMIQVEGSVKDYLEGVGTREHSGVKIPFIAVPTTSGTGSEATKNAVISSVGKDGFKKSLRHDNFVPDIAVVDPGLTISCPAALTAASGMDCFTQLTEAYLSVKSNEVTDALALKAIEVLAASLREAWKDGNDINARSGMSFAALMSGICLANAGLGTVHGFASSLGALYDIPHGVVCGTLMAPANDITLRELKKQQPDHPAIRKYSVLGKIFADDDRSKSDDYYAGLFIDVLYEFTDYLELPGLGGYGVRAEDAETIVSLTENKNNPVKLLSCHMKEILLSRIK